MTRPLGTSPMARAQRENDSSSPKLCTLGPPMTTRRAPRRDAITPSARSAANACLIVPRDTRTAAASSLSDGSFADAAYSPDAMAALMSSATFGTVRHYCCAAGTPAFRPEVMPRSLPSACTPGNVSAGK